MQTVKKVLSKKAIKTSYTKSFRSLSVSSANNFGLKKITQRQYRKQCELKLQKLIVKVQFTLR